MRVSVFSAKGVKTEKKLDLPEDIFGVKPRPAVLRQYIHVYQKTQRSGTLATKTRGDVSGGGRKPWAQKGTGRARQGSVRSPIWVGGGVAHGPHPRDFAAILPKKMKDLTLRLALSAKAAAGQVYVVVDPVFKAPKTSQARELLAKIKVSRPLVVLAGRDVNVQRSFRNLAEAATVEVANLNPYAVLKAGDLVLFRGSIDNLKKRLGKEKKAEKKEVKPVDNRAPARLLGSRREPSKKVSGRKPAKKKR